MNKPTPRKRDVEGGAAGPVVGPARQAAHARMAYGGKTVYGARVGILMLETRWPRVPGDTGNAHTWPFPVLYRVVRGATAKKVIVNRGQGLLEPFLEAADAMVRDGADGITTTGGFLSLFQRDLAAHCKVPVATSSLMQIPLVQRLLPPNKRVGVITVNGPALDAAHLEPCGADLDTPIVGTETGRELTRVLMNDEPTLDLAAAERDMLEAGDAMTSRHPDVGAIVLECANMAPFARALSEHVRMPVFSIYTFVTWFHAGLSPRDFGHPGSAPRPFRER